MGFAGRGRGRGRGRGGDRGGFERGRGGRGGGRGGYGQPQWGGSPNGGGGPGGNDYGGGGGQFTDYVAVPSNKCGLIIGKGNLFLKSSNISLRVYKNLIYCNVLLAGVYSIRFLKRIFRW